MTPLLIVSICLSFIFQLPTHGEIGADLRDPYLEREYDWAIYLDAHDLKHYLNYPTSQLHPLTDVRINFRMLPRSTNTASRQPAASLYEEFWYQRGMPVGLRRYTQLKIAPNRFGVIVVGAMSDEPGHAAAVADALVRLLLDLKLKEIVTSVVMVPNNKYEQLTGDLGRYGFFPFMRTMEGQQMSIHLRSYPQGKDQYYWYQKGY